MAAIEKLCPEAKNLLLIPESHTRNRFYLMNVQRLVQILTQAGLHVRLGTLDSQIHSPTSMPTPDGSSLLLEPLVRQRNRVGLKDFDPCTILLNNDLSAGVPEILQNLHEQHLVPPLHAGWATRRKTHHFACYDSVAKKFAKLLGIDAWLINPLFEKCGQVNFAEGTGITCIQDQVSTLLSKVRRKYKDYGIDEKPFVVVKADAGTYGMGIMMVRDPKELAEMGRRTKNKMSVIKDGQAVSEVIIQEGVHTFERVQDAVAEPVVYMLDRYVVGGFYRVHAERGIDENLNAPGATFVPLAFEPSSQLPRPGVSPGVSIPNRFYMYGVVARLAMLAASYELESFEADQPNSDVV
jgi:glutamate--cysteine ligase